MCPHLLSASGPLTIISQGAEFLCPLLIFSKALKIYTDTKSLSGFSAKTGLRCLDRYIDIRVDFSYGYPLCLGIPETPRHSVYKFELFNIDDFHKLIIPYFLS